MREIKFRVWDNDSKSYYGNDFAVDQDGVVMRQIPLADEAAGCGWDVWMPADRALEQYTGLKGKNGKEIYEGDIVKCGISSKVSHVGVIGYGEDVGRMVGCGFTVLYKEPLPVGCPAEELIGFLWAGCAKPEVIGNIHENPELVK